MNEDTEQGDDGRQGDARLGKDTENSGDVPLSSSSQQSQQPEDPPVPGEVPGSPVGSQTSQSTSSRQSERRRIVELIQINNDDESQADDNWMIGEEFYQEDVAADDEDDGVSDDEYEIEHEDNQVVPLSDADSTEDEDEVMDFELAPNEQDQLAGISSDDDDGDQDEGAVDYDISLPVEHRYLGESLQESSGREILVENSIITLPLFNIRHIVLLPGQVLPITTEYLNSRIQLHLRACINRKKLLIGMMSDPRENPYGTTAEIRSYAIADEDGGLKVILEGRQRFRLISQPFETTVEGLTVILPEISLGRPFCVIPSWQRFLSGRETALKFIVSRHPKWLVRSHEASSLAKRISKQIPDWCDKAPVGNVNDFSYWVASSLPISNPERMKVLRFDCTEARLLWLLGLLERSKFLGCSVCRNVICHRKEVFLMSCSGPQNSFVNPSGVIHDTLTVSTAQGLIYVQRQWSTEYSWFPGYAWKSASCGHCSRHIGWCFKSTQPDTKPKRFWGLTRSSVRLQTDNMVEEEDEDSSRDMIMN